MDNDREAQKSEPPGSRSAVTLEIDRHIKRLTSEDLHLRSESVSELEKFGKPAAERLVDRLLTKPVSHEYLRSFEEALEEIGRPAAAVLVHGLSKIPEIKKAEDVYLLELFVETLGRLGERRSAKVVAEQLGKLDRRIEANHNRLLTDVCTAAKVRVHVVLAEFESREGLENLLAMLGDGRRRVADGIVRALEAVGDSRALLPLTRLHAIEEPVTFAGGQLIKEVVRQVLRREKVGPKDKVLKDFNPEERAAFDRLAGWSKH